MLKTITDGLSRDWLVNRTIEPFYGGGAIGVRSSSSASSSSSSSESITSLHPQIVCLNDGNVSILHSRDSPAISLFDSADEYRDEVTCLCLHPSKDEIVVSLKRNMLENWDMNKKTLIRSLKGHNMPVLSMAYDATGTLLATGSADRTVRVWDIPRGHCTHVFRKHSEMVTLVKFHPDPTKLWLFSSSDDCSINIYDLKKKKCISTFNEHMSPVADMAISHSIGAEGIILASAGRDKILNLFNMQSLSHIKTVAVMDELECVSILSASHSASVLGISDNSHKDENPSNGKSKKQTGSSSSSSASSSFVLLTAGRKGLIHIFKGTGNNGSFTCELLRSILLSGIPSDNLVSASSKAAASQFDILKAIMSIHYVESDHKIIAVTEDRDFYFFDLQEDKLEAPSYQFMGCNDDILDLAIVPGVPVENENGEIIPVTPQEIQVAVVTNSAQVRLVAMQTGYEFKSLSGHKEVVLSVSVSPDG